MQPANDHVTGDSKGATSNANTPNGFKEHIPISINENDRKDKFDILNNYVAKWLTFAITSLIFMPMLSYWVLSYTNPDLASLWLDKSGRFYFYAIIPLTSALVALVRFQYKR